MMIPSNRVPPRRRVALASVTFRSRVLNEKNAFAMDSEPAYWRLVCPRWLLPMHHERRLAEAAAGKQSAASAWSAHLEGVLPKSNSGRARRSARAALVREPQTGWIFASPTARTE